MPSAIMTDRHLGIGYVAACGLAGRFGYDFILTGHQVDVVKLDLASLGWRGSNDALVKLNGLKPRGRFVK